MPLSSSLWYVVPCPGILWEMKCADNCKISALFCSSLVAEGIKHGLGMHYQSISDPRDRIEAFKYTIIAPNFSVISTTTGKISVVLFLLRMMGQAATKAKRYFLFAITLVSVIANVMCLVVLIGFCIPAHKIWDPSVPGHCMTLRTQLVIGIFQACQCFPHVVLLAFRERVLIQMQRIMHLPTSPWPSSRSLSSGMCRFH